MVKKEYLGIIVGMLLLCTVGGRGEEENLVSNGDFMQVKEDGTPKEWEIIAEYVGEGSYEIKVDAEAKYNDKNSLRVMMKGAEYNFANTKGGITIRSKGFPVTPGEKYLLTYNLKTQGVEATKKPDGNYGAPGSKYMTMLFQFLDADGGSLSCASKYYFFDVMEFGHQSLNVTIPENAYLGMVQLWLSNFSKGDEAIIWLNDVKVKKEA